MQILSRDLRRHRQRRTAGIAIFWRRGRLPLLAAIPYTIHPAWFAFDNLVNARQDRLWHSTSCQVARRAAGASSNHLIGGSQQPFRDAEAEGFGGLEVDDEL